MNDAPTSLQRVLTTLGHAEPDRVPLLLPVTMHGAVELGMTQREYFSSGENVAEGQMLMREKYGHDSLAAFFYAPIEIEAWGGEVIHREDGPANSGEPFIRDPESIVTLEPPRIDEASGLREVLRCIEILSKKCTDALIVGLVVSPFSVPVMQMGFDNYLDLMAERLELFERLMTVNEQFCVDWANAQLAAGATAICYFDPVSSTTIVDRELYRATGMKVAQRTLARIGGPTATHFASGRCLDIIDDVATTGTAVVGVSAEEDLAELKRRAAGKMCVLGNLNGIEMRRWTPGEAETAVKRAIAAAGPGGGFILSDNHGEIPLQVPEEILHAVCDANRRWGRYPLTWIRDEAVNDR